MTVLTIRLFPDPILRQKAEPVKEFDSELRRLIDNMLETMMEAPGVGLAAPQIGLSQRVAVLDPDPGGPDSQQLVLVNPEILNSEGRDVDSEGCLSIPEFTEKVPRATQLLLRARDADGTPYELEATDFLARVVQHEVDHLDGILFIDRLRGLRRERGRRHLKKLSASS